MSGFSSTRSFSKLQNHYEALNPIHMRDLFASDPERFARFNLVLGDILFDYSKNRITRETMALLFDLAREQDLQGAITAMFGGEKINNTEGRAVLHTALRNRSDRPVLVDGEDVMPAVKQVLSRMGRFVDEVRSGRWKGFTGKPITDIVNIGIGG
ncbi:glucose-6-phosphate isomerase, partial [Myxococcota bacterium]|nr:glucose-6-phosphate isomerase [Myxococcota bacterium]